MVYKDYVSFASQVVKGRIAETLVEEMFKKSGYKVYRFGYEAILQNISQSNVDIKESDTKEKIQSIPDFIVVSPNGSIQLIEVKYRSDGNIKPMELEKYAYFWEEARIILVSPKEPHFRISYISRFLKDGKLYPLENDRFTTINSEIIKKFSDVVKEYFKE